MRIRRTIAAAAAVLLCVPFVLTGAGQAEENTAAYGTPVADSARITSADGTLTLTVDAVTGTLRVDDRLTGKLWASNFDRPEDDPVSTGVNNENVRSPLLIEYDSGGTNRQSDSFARCRDSGEGELRLYCAADRITAVYCFTALGITVPVEYRLTGRALTAAVPGDGVRETGDAVLTAFTLLPFFGAGGREEDGYILLPDGAGALIRFNNGKTDEGRLTLQAMYGDRTKPDESPQQKTQPVLVPGFGLRHETAGAGLFCYAAEGAYGGQITANVAGRESGLNYAYYTFMYRSTDTVVQMEGTYMAKARPIYDTQNTGAAAYTMHYGFLAPDDGGVGGMARACRALLLGERQTLTAEEMPLIADLYLGVRVRTNFLGIPYDTLRPLTTFAQAGEMAAALRTGGVPRLMLRLLGYDSDGAVGGRIKTSLKAAAVLGGNDGLLSLQRQPGVSVYPEAELTAFNRGGGLLPSRKTAFDLQYDEIRQYTFTVASGMATDDAPFRLAKAGSIVRSADALAASLDKAGVTGVSSVGLGLAPYADYTRRDPYRLQETADAMAQAARRLSDGRSLMLCAPTAGTLASADVLRAMPVCSSGYPLEDTDVPFLPMVLSGYVVYGGEDITMAGDKRESLLRSIECGSALSASLMWAEHEAVKKTGLEGLYACTFSAQAERLQQQYRELAEVLDGVWGTPMADVTSVGKTVRVVRYQNGTCVAVNYGRSSANVDGKTVPARGYAVYGGGGA